MSSTTGNRIANDDYPTPSWPIQRLLERVWLPRGRILEPCAGEGSVIRTMLGMGWHDSTFHAIEIQDRYREQLAGVAQVQIGDLRESSWLPLERTEANPPFDLAITNPAFSIAFEVLKRCRANAAFTCLLLPLGFLEAGSSPRTIERSEFLEEDWPDTHHIPNRIAFSVSPTTGKVGTDSNTYAWMVWGPEKRREGRTTRLALTSNEVRAASRDAIRERAGLPPIRKRNGAAVEHG